MSAKCSLAYAVLPEGFCAVEVPVSLAEPRSILSLSARYSLVLERASSSVVQVDTETGEKRVLVSAFGLNHGLALTKDFIYAISNTSVFRWKYQNEATGNLSISNPQYDIIVENISADGMGGAPQGHQTRTLVFDRNGLLYISVGSSSNIDSNSFRSRIRRCNIDVGSSFPIDFQTCTVFADGLRNTVGMAFDQFGVLWGVENSADRLSRDDLGGDIHNDNPAEELNQFTSQGTHYGYPYCWTEFYLEEPDGIGRGTVWAWPTFLGNITDEDCRSRYQKPVLALQAHSAPLSIAFYRYRPPDEIPDTCSGTFPSYMNGYAFIAYHGSWNRDVPTGYKIVYIAFDSDGNPIDEPVDLLAHEPPNAQWNDGFRPVGVDFDECGRLVVTSDGTKGVGSKLVRIAFDPNNGTHNPSPTDTAIETNKPSRVDEVTSNAGTPQRVPLLCLCVLLLCIQRHILY